MADVSISKFTQLIRLQGQASVPSLPPSTEDTPPAVNPPGSGGLTGVNQFIQLTDTPATYSGATLNYARVNAGETGLEFRTPAQVLADIGGIGGNIAAGQVAFGTGVNTIGGDSGLTFNNILKRILVTSPTYDSILLSRTGSQNVALGFETTIAKRYIGFDLNSNVFGITSSVLAFGSAPFRVNPTNGNIFTAGTVAINTTSPTNTLDVNGDVRVRTLANATGNFVTTSATGVLQQRTASEVLSDIGAQALITGVKTEGYVATIISGVETWAESQIKWNLIEW